MTVAIDDGLAIEGYASLWGVADLNGDVVALGAFAESLKRTGAGGVRMLHQHESRAVVGVWDEMVEDERGLFVRGRIADWSAEARYAQALSRAGALDGLSIGFRAARARRDGRLRVLSGVELWEVSLVTFPMLPGARFQPRPMQSIQARARVTPPSANQASAGPVSDW
jgi:HK97 family phage prohead protease